jgi:acetyltransferase-like isoleucine patch superfamily enzyme
LIQNNFFISCPLRLKRCEKKNSNYDAWADIGTNAVILSGVTIGKSSTVGVGAVVTKDVASFSVVAGSPAKFLKWREGYVAEEDYENNE